MTHTASDRQAPNTFGLVLVAAAAGAIAGMLFAPKRGSEMRQDIKNKAHDVKDKTKDQMSQKADTVRNKAHDVADKAADKTKSMADRASEATKSASDRAADEAKNRTNR